MTSVVLHWSGGKDSALALHALRQDPRVRVVGLLTTSNPSSDRVTTHGVPMALVRQQAENLQLPLTEVPLPESVPLVAYNAALHQAHVRMRDDGVMAVAFGDLFLEDLRHYRQQQARAAGLQARFPLWKRDPRALLRTFWQLGFRAKVVCVNATRLGQAFAGRELNKAFVRDLPPGVDACGENGEYHTFVYDAPNFARPLCCTVGSITHQTLALTTQTTDPATTSPPAQWDTGFWYADLLPA